METDQIRMRHRVTPCCLTLGQYVRQNYKLQTVVNQRENTKTHQFTAI